MNILPCKDADEAVKFADDIYDKWCDTTRVKTPREERVSRRFDNPVVHADTKEVPLLSVGEIPTGESSPTTGRTRVVQHNLAEERPPSDLGKIVQVQ